MIPITTLVVNYPRLLSSRLGLEIVLPQAASLSLEFHAKTDELLPQSSLSEAPEPE